MHHAKTLALVEAAPRYFASLELPRPELSSPVPQSARATKMPSPKLPPTTAAAAARCTAAALLLLLLPSRSASASGVTRGTLVLRRGGDSGDLAAGIDESIFAPAASAEVGPDGELSAAEDARPQCKFEGIVALSHPMSLKSNGEYILAVFCLNIIFIHR